MYRMSAVATIAATMAFGAATAFAQEDENWGPYLGLGYGDFSSEIDEIEDVDIEFDEDEDAWKAFAGWRFGPWLALQLDYVDFGQSKATFNLLNIDAETEGLAPSVVLTLPVGPVELFARAGMLFYDVEIRRDDDIVIDDSGDDPVYSAGLGLTLLGRLNLRAEYEVVDISEFSDAEAGWLTAAWRF